MTGQTFKAEQRATATADHFDGATWFVCVEPQEIESRGGAQVIRVGFPVVAVTGFVADPERFARKVAELLTAALANEAD